MFVRESRLFSFNNISFVAILNNWIVNLSGKEARYFANNFHEINFKGLCLLYHNNKNNSSKIFTIF